MQQTQGQTLTNEETIAIIEGNKLIAEFLGHSKCQRCGDCGGYQFGALVYFPDEMQYHSNWQWLMPVVERIEAMGFDFWLQTNKPTRNVVTFWQDNHMICQSQNEHKLTAVWLAVIEFIKWFNQK